MKICMISERLRPPYDEGIKNVFVNLVSALAKEHEVLAVTCGGHEDKNLGIYNVETNRLLLSTKLARMIRRFLPEAIVYVPTACGTLFSFLRAKLLRAYGKGTRTAVLTLQPRPYTALGRFLIRSLAPDRVFAQSTRTATVLQSLGCSTALLPPAVDILRFRPAPMEKRDELRRAWGVPADAKVVTHVGHLKGKRNLGNLLAFQALPGYHVLVVASSSTTQDEALKQSLRHVGATVIDTYVERIEDVYRLSDIYLFLAQAPTAAIDLPLSVLEAMACNLIVISTPFGGLPDFFQRVGQGFYYWYGQEPLQRIAEKALSAPIATRALVEPYTWSAAAETLVRSLYVDDGGSRSGPFTAGAEVA